MTASIRKVKSKLSELLDSVEKGEEIIITSNGRPRGRIVPMAPARKMSFDFDKMRKLAKQASTGKKGPDSTQIISDLREDRI